MRAFDANFTAGIESSQARIIRLFSFSFQNYTDDEINRYYNSEWYYAADIRMGEIVHTGSMSVDRMTIEIGSVNRRIISHLLSADRRGTTVTVDAVLLDSNNVIDYVERIFTGELDGWEIDEEVARIDCVSTWVRWSKKTLRRCTGTCVRHFKQSNHLLCYYPFKEATGTTLEDDAGIVSADGTLVGSLTWGNDTDIGNYLEWNQASNMYVDVPMTSALYMGSYDFIISGWVYPKSGWAQREYFLIYDIGLSRIGISIYPLDSSPRFYGYIYDKNGAGTHGYISTAGSVAFDQWTHFTVGFSRTDDKVYCYVNGAKDAVELDISAAAADIEQSSNMRFGYFNGNDYRLHGRLSDIRIFRNLTLTQSLATDLYTYRSKIGGLVDGNCVYAGTGYADCDKSYEHCVARAETTNFAGFKYLPELEERDLWWGRVKG